MIHESKKAIVNHIAASIITLAIFLILTGFGSDGFLLIILFAAIPMLGIIYYLHKHLNHSFSFRIFQVIFLPLLGGSIVPAYMFYVAFQKDDNWLKLGVTIIILTNFVLYIVNEACFFYYFRKMKALS